MLAANLKLILRSHHGVAADAPLALHNVDQHVVMLVHHL